MAAVIVFERVLELTLAVEPVYFPSYNLPDMRIKFARIMFMSIRPLFGGLPQRRVEVQLCRCGIDAEAYPALYTSVSNAGQVQKINDEWYE